ncbi:hypothetical protein DQ04_10921020, partial [Trypanosoma grayi]|uniref:hypothetical protein n=1 Tax=Trypanosoma grayi TaxID=71804 RepID=UPI0004F47F13
FCCCCCCCFFQVRGARGESSRSGKSNCAALDGEAVRCGVCVVLCISATPPPRGGMLLLFLPTPPRCLVACLSEQQVEWQGARDTGQPSSSTKRPWQQQRRRHERYEEGWVREAWEARNKFVWTRIAKPEWKNRYACTTQTLWQKGGH